MSKDVVHSLAQADTPALIDVPNTWSGLVVWAVGRFGVGVLFAAVCVVGITRVYGDIKELNKELVQLIREQAQTSAGLQLSISKLETTISTVALDAHKAHNTQP